MRDATGGMPLATVAHPASASRRGTMQFDPRRLQVNVELMNDPCLWRWEIRDAGRNEVVADSWTRDWAAYESREEAYRAGRARLTAFLR
jgi:hypothetical protein